MRAHLPATLCIPSCYNHGRGEVILVAVVDLHAGRSGNEHMYICTARAQIYVQDNMPGRGGFCTVATSLATDLTLGSCPSSIACICE